jgi:hypothetical protein
MRYDVGKSVLLIFASILISWALAITVDLNNYELGAVFNLFLPPIIGVFTILFFLVFNAIFKHWKIQRIIIIVCCLINIYVGLVFHFEFGYLPFGL